MHEICTVEKGQSQKPSEAARTANGPEEAKTTTKATTMEVMIAMAVEAVKTAKTAMAVEKDDKGRATPTWVAHIPSPRSNIL